MRIFERIWQFATSKAVKWIATTTVALLGIWGTFFYERKPDVQIDVISDSAVFDVKEPLSKLDVLYDGIRLKENKETLRIFIVRVFNVGNADILKSHFDESAPFGIKFSTGRILEVPTIKAEEYLQANLRAIVKDERTVVFSPVILNASDGFEIKVLLLAADTQRPSIVPIGKIAGIKEVRTVLSTQDAGKKFVVEEAVSGPAKIQFARLAIYPLAFLLGAAVLIITIVVPGIWISELVQKRRTHRTLLQFREKGKRELSAQEEFVLKVFEEDGAEALILRRLAAKGAATVDEFVRRLRIGHEANISVQDQASVLLEKQLKRNAVSRLESSGLIIVDGPQLALNPIHQEFIIEFFVFADPEFASEIKSSPGMDVTAVPKSVESERS